MDRILLVEESTTRRRAVNGLLGAKGFQASEVPGFEAALPILRRLGSSPIDFRAIVIGWPDYSDSGAEELFALLHQDEFEHLPVLLLADDNDPAAVNWMMRRPSTALLLWSDYSECADALTKMMIPASATQPALELAGQSHLRVLFVDDSATVRVAFRRLMMKQGFLVETANNVVEGLERALAAPFDIAIIDYFMPGDNGSVLVRQLKDNPKTSSILSAVITGTYSDRVIQESLASGAVECLFKSEAKELFLARLSSIARTVMDRKFIDTERRRLRGILSSVGEGVYGVDGRGIIEFINPTALDLLGYGEEQDLIGLSAFETFHYAFEDGTPMPRAACFLSQCYNNGNQIPGWQTVFWSTSKRAVAVECTVYPMQIDGQRQGSVVAFRDISARRMLEEELRWQATHDSLTKLNNRGWFETQLESEISRLKRSDQVSAVLFLDLDRFKYINDTAGHGAGDQMLIEVSHRLKSRLRASDHLARMGGDEYALILRNIAAADVGSLADEFRKALIGTPFAYGGKSYRIGVSIGAARLDQHTASPTEAMANADIACHLAKNRGRNQTHVYSRESDQRAAMDIELGWSARLEEALRNNGFMLAFQPIMAISAVEFDQLPQQDGALWARHLRRTTDRRAVYEVLIRLRESNGNLVAPDAFLPTAERFNMLIEIDRWVIHHAFKAMRENAGGEHAIGLSINLTAQSLAHGGLARYITDKLVEFNIDPRAITFEITESSALTNLDAARSLIQEIRAHGCRFALDDFGVGFSSFAHLKHLDVDFLKIDGSFTQGLLDDPVDLAVITAITAIAHSVGKLTVAEYVDRPEILRALRNCGVDFAQGFYVGRPKLSLRAAAGQLEIIAGGEDAAPGAQQSSGR